MQTPHVITAAIAMGIVTTTSSADITGFLDYEEWKNAVGAFETIDFTEYPEGTIITDQYSHLDVLFTDGNDQIYHTSSFVKDGAGLFGSVIDLQITVEFDSPQLWFGVDHPGWAFLDIYSGDTLLGTFENWWGVLGAFTGIISETLFDKIIIHRGYENASPFIDDLHWGVPAPGALAVLAFAGLLGGSRRRRK